jgi:hypothetical protein
VNGIDSGLHPGDESSSSTGRELVIGQVILAYFQSVNIPFLTRFLEIFCYKFNLFKITGLKICQSLGKEHDYLVIHYFLAYIDTKHYR